MPYPLLYPAAKLRSVSHVSPEQHSKMFDLQVTALLMGRVIHRTQIIKLRFLVQQISCIT